MNSERWFHTNTIHSKTAGLHLLFLVTHRGIEPLFSPWEGDVLTAWPMGRINLHNNFIPAGTKCKAKYCPLLLGWFCLWSQTREILGRKLLQKIKSSKLFSLLLLGDPYENRTRDTAVKGRCLNRLTNGPYMWTAFAVFWKTPDWLLPVLLIYIISCCCYFREFLALYP